MGIQPKETPLLLLVIDDVEGIKDGFHAGVGALPLSGKA
jgi:hypothetical protein